MVSLYARILRRCFLCSSDSRSPYFRIMFASFASTSLLCSGVNLTPVSCSPCAFAGWSECRSWGGANKLAGEIEIAAATAASRPNSRREMCAGFFLALSEVVEGMRELLEDELGTGL
jgi:hypothetical protein